MNTKTSIFIIFVSILVSFGIGIYFYPQLPEKMASHWNGLGEVNGYMSKFWGIFLLPVMSIGLFLLFLILPKIDPLRKNFAGFKKYYNTFIAFISDVEREKCKSFAFALPSLPAGRQVPRGLPRDSTSEASSIVSPELCSGV